MPSQRRVSRVAQVRASARARGATCQLRPPTPSQRRVSCERGAIAVSREEAQHSSLLARAPCRAGCGRPMPVEGRCAGERPLFFGARPWCDVPAAASTPSQRRCDARAARLRSSLGRRRSTQACCARAVPRWLWSAHALQRALRRREASLLRRAPWCDVPAAASNAKPAPRVRTRSARLRSLSLGGGAALELAARAPCRAGCGWPMLSTRTLHRREASLLRRAPVVRRASCGLQRQASAACARAARTALAVSREEAQHSSLPLARAVLRWLWSAILVQKDTAPARGLSLFGARPWCDVPAAASNAKPAPRVPRGAGTPALAVSREEAQHSACAARAPCCAGCGRHMPRKGTAGERPLSFGARPWCDVPAAASNAKPAPRVIASAPALAVSGEEAQHSSLLARAPWRAGCGRLMRLGEGQLRRREASLLRRAAVVRRASCGLQRQASAACLARRRRACARCLWGGGAALKLAARARRAALVVVGLCSRKGAAPARGLSPSARGRGATCQLRPPTPSQRRVSRAAQARLRSLSLGRRRSTRACCVRAPCRAGCGRLMHCRRALRRREASLLRRAPVVRRASCGLQRQASAACHARRRACARCL